MVLTNGTGTLCVLLIVVTAISRWHAARDRRVSRRLRALPLMLVCALNLGGAAPLPIAHADETITVSVPAAQPWTDTGIDLSVGETVTISASGIIHYSSADPGTPPAGAGCTSGDGYMIPSLPCISLIGRVGDGTPFEVGTGTGLTVSTPGRLYLGVNDSFFGDNSGAWTAMISITSSIEGPNWTQVGSFPDPRVTLQSTTTDGNYLYVIGNGSPTGVPPNGFNSDGFYAPVNSDGTLGTWLATTPLPVPLVAQEVVESDGYVFVIGGYKCCWGGVSTVYSAPIEADGSLGSWSSVSALPTDLYRSAALAYDGHLLVLGGTSDDEGGAIEARVFSATVNADGSISSWTVASTMPMPLHTEAAVISNGYLVVVGGLNSLSDSSVQSQVYSAPITSDGTIGAWQQQASLPQGLSVVSAVASQKSIIVTGGATADSSPAPHGYIADVSPGGTIGAWTGLAALPSPLMQAGTVAVGGNIYVISGQTTGSNWNPTVYALADPAPASGDWPQWQSDPQHQGVNTAATIAPPLGVLCTALLGSPIYGQVVANGVVYVTTQDLKVRALDSHTCKILWTYQADGPTLYAPVFDSGIIFVLNAGGPVGTVQHVVALDATTGSFKWEQWLTGGRGTDGAVPVVRDGVVYVAGGDWKVHAFDASTGAVLWRTDVDDGAVSSPAVANGVVYATTFNQATLYAFNAKTGGIIWSEHADGNWYANNPIVMGNRIYIGGSQGRVHAVDATTGNFIWTTTVPTEPTCAPALGNGILYKSDYAGTVYTFNAQTGAPGWTYKAGGQTCATVTLTNGDAYIEASGGLTALNPETGSVLGSVPPMGGGFTSSPAIGPDALYVGSADGTLYALTSTQGRGTTPPVTQANLTPSPTSPGVYPGPVTVTLSATAASGSTIANTYYTVDGGSQQTYASPFTVSGEGSHTITYWSVDSAGVPESPNTLTFQIASLVITTDSPLPSGTVGVAYSETLQASGGTKPYTWSITSGALPPGLNLDPSSGTISGTPTTAGTFSFTVQVQDSSSFTATKQFTFSPPPPSGTAGSGYSVPISITPPSSGGGGGGTPPACSSYALAPGSGALPPGLTLDPTTGIISGTPTDGGTYTFTVQCSTGGGGQTATKDFTITIDNPTPALTSLGPNSTTAGGAGFTLTVDGSNFVTSSTVQWNGSSRPTTYVSATELMAAISASDVASSGTPGVTVVNPAPGGGTSTALTFTINSPDTTPPTTTASATLGTGSTPYTFGGWTNQGVQVTLSATDNPGGSGVATTYYAVDNPACTPSALSTCTTYTGSPFTVGTEGSHTLTYFSIDNAGNAETAHTASILIDTTAPHTAATLSPAPNAAGWNKGPVQVTLNATDSAGGSGVQQIVYDAGGAQTIGSTTVAGSTAALNVTAVGVTTLTYAATDVAGNTEATESTPIRIDKTAPSCVLTGTGVNGSGQKYIQITVQDGGSGLGSVAVTESNNATTPVPSFTAGTISPVIVTATKINQSQGAQVALKVTDVAGNVTNCDPVLTDVIRDANQPTTTTATGIDQSEHLLHIYNGDPGLTHLVIDVDGKKVHERDLVANQQYTVDIAAWLQPGSNNTVTIIARGKQRGDATIVIADS